MAVRSRPSRRAVVAAVGLIGLAAPLAAADRKVRLVAFGDSLTAGYGLAADQGFVPRLAAALEKAGVHAEVIGAGVSGDTTDMGLARLDWSVPADADAVIVELGANDALRGLPPDEARRNLDEIVDRLRKRGQEVLVAGMLAPKNLGPAYAAAFDPIFADVAAAHDALLYPFFLDGVALDRSATLPDGLHPNPTGIERIVERILPKVLELVARVRSRRP